MAEIAVIIPHLNDALRLRRCLTELMPQVTDEVEVVVVDNGSKQPLDELRRDFPWVRFLLETRKGAAEARNRGVAETDAKALAFIDSDCVPAADWIAVARAVGDLGDLIGGRVDVFDETPPPRSGAQAFETVFAFDFRTYVEKKGFSGSGNLVTRRDVFDATGPFLTGLSEDLNWCHRATALGFRLAYADHLRVQHPTRDDWPALRRKWRRLTDEGFGINGNTPGARLHWALRAVAMPASAVVHVPKMLRHPTLRDWGERRRGLSTLFRLRLLRMIWMLDQAVRGR